MLGSRPVLHLQECMDFGAARGGNMSMTVVTVRILICYGELMKVPRQRKSILFKRVSDLHDFMSSYTVEWIHTDRRSYVFDWNFTSNRNVNLDGVVLVAGLFFQLLNCSTLYLVTLPLQLVTSLPRHLVSSSSRIVLSSSLLRLSARPAPQSIITITSLRNQLA